MSFTSEIGEHTLYQIGSKSNEDIEKIIVETNAFNTTNCWFMEFQLKSIILMACQNILEKRVDSLLEHKTNISG